MSDLTEIFGDVIHAYTREQALEDGFLVDVTATAAEAGFRWPVAMTRTAWEKYVVVPEGAACQDVQGRLWDVVWMAFCEIRRIGSRGSGQRLLFQLYVRNDNRRPKLVTLALVSGPGDQGEPVVTLMLPDES